MSAKINQSKELIMKTFKSHKQAAKSLEKLINKFPGMPEELKQSLQAAADVHKKASKTYTAEDVFMEEAK
jgi:hypothetical protein